MNSEVEAKETGGRGLTAREYCIAGAAIVTGAAAGLTLMYLFDPDRGKRRRVQLLEQAESKARRLGKEVAAKAEDVYHRAQGAVREATRCAGEEVTDDVLRDRVRSRLGHIVPRPGQVETEVNHGIVELRGTLPATERSSLLKNIRAIPGVRGVEDLLEARS